MNARGLCAVIGWVLLIASACGPARPGPTPAPPPEVPAQAPDTVSRGPLPETRKRLDRALLDAESALADGIPLRPARVAHLRMTTAALNSIDAGNLEHALDLLERAVSVDGTAGYAFAYLGYLYAESGRADQALAFVDQALSLLPPEPAVSGELIELRSFAASQRER